MTQSFTNVSRLKVPKIVRMNATNASTVTENDLFEGTTTIVIYVCIGTVGVVGNSFVIFVFTKSANMRKKMVNILLINQSATDLAASISLVTIGHVKFGGQVIATFSGVAADLYCKLIGSTAVVWGLASCSTWNLVFINIERFIGVSFPVWHKTSLSKRHIVGVICFVWIFNLTFVFFTVVLTSSHSNGTCLFASEWLTNELSIFGSVISFLVQFLLPVITIIFCYIVIVKVLRQKGKVGNFVGHMQDSGQDKIERNVLKTLALVSVTFIVCWTPNLTVYYLHVAKIIDMTLISESFYHTTVVLVFLNFCLNPFIYAAQYKDFQKQMTKLCGRAASVDSVTTGTSSVSTQDPVN